MIQRPEYRAGHCAGEESLGPRNLRICLEGLGPASAAPLLQRKRYQLERFWRGIPRTGNAGLRDTKAAII
jgi:hypothetical protein